MRIGAILVEFDGVVADTDPLRRETLSQVLSVAGIQLTDEEYWEYCAGATLAGGIRAVVAGRNSRLDETDLDLLAHRAEQRFTSHVGKGVTLVDGARSTLERLAAHTRLAVVTRLRRQDVEAITTMGRLDHLFSFVIGAEDANPPKPHPAPYEAAIRRLGRYRGNTQDVVVALENGLEGIRSARGAGLHCVAVGTQPAHVVLEAQAWTQSITGLDAASLSALLDSPGNS